MTQRSINRPVYRVRMLPKDLGVAAVVLVALLAGWLVYWQATSRTRTFTAEGSPFSIAYPAAWIGAQAGQDRLLTVSDPEADSSFKTTLSVEGRELDPQNPPTLQTLMDRRVGQRAGLAGYHFLNNKEATVGGAKGVELEYAYVAQPIDTPRRASLPVVVHAREVIVITADRTFYISLAAPENEFERASAQFDRMLQTVQVQ